MARSDSESEYEDAVENIPAAAASSAECASPSMPLLESRLLSLPPELRLRIYDELMHSVAATWNGMLETHGPGYMLAASLVEQGSAFFFSTIIPKCTLVCKQFTGEYEDQVLSQTSITLCFTHAIAKNPEALPWHGLAPQRRVFQMIRRCDIQIWSSVALGGGKPWQVKAANWLKMPLQQQQDVYGDWTPTKQVFEDLHEFLINFRRLLSPRARLHFAVDIPFFKHDPLASNFDLDAFVNMLADSEEEHCPVDQLSITLRHTCYIDTTLDCPGEYWTRRRVENAGGIYDGPEASVTCGPRIGFYEATMIQVGDDEWDRGEWEFIGVHNSMELPEPL